MHLMVVLHINKIKLKIIIFILSIGLYILSFGVWGFGVLGSLGVPAPPHVLANNTHALQSVTEHEVAFAPKKKGVCVPPAPPAPTPPRSAEEHQPTARSSPGTR
jgi:hypothetical protein